MHYAVKAQRSRNFGAAGNVAQQVVQPSNSNEIASTIGGISKILFFLFFFLSQRCNPPSSSPMILYSSLRVNCHYQIATKHSVSVEHGIRLVSKLCTIVWKSHQETN